MRRNTNSRQSKMNAFASLAVILLCIVVVSATQVFAQTRMGRPPSGRELEGTAILPAGAQAILEGTVLIVEMDTRIDSGNARVSDRFSARIATPVVDANGRTLLQAGTRIEGHVTSVNKAKWRHRSGEVGLSFDYIAMGDGRQIPIRGSLVSASRRVDEEGNLRAGSSTRRDILVTTGGAAAGAGIGAAVGGGNEVAGSLQRYLEVLHLAEVANQRAPGALGGAGHDVDQSGAAHRIRLNPWPARRSCRPPC